MSVPVLEAIADAITQYEGWGTGSRSYRNRNPGNLRAASKGQLVDDEGYRVFDGLVGGYLALLKDLRAKVTGDNVHGLDRASTLAELFAVYAPASNANSPVWYAEFVAGWLCRVYRAEVSVNSTVTEVFAVAGQEVPARVERSA